MTKWTFINRSLLHEPVAVLSANHAVELLEEQSGWPGRPKYGVVLDFVHSERGSITCIANKEVATISFDPQSRPGGPSGSTRRYGIRRKPLSKEPFYFVDGTGLASPLPLNCVLLIAKVKRAVEQIIEDHDFPNCIRWSWLMPGGDEER